MKPISLAFSILSLIWTSSSAAEAEQGSFVGKWNLMFHCDGLDQQQLLTITSASDSEIIGVMYVVENQVILKDRRGDIVDGQQSGNNVVFRNKFRWDSKRYTQDWVGKLSRNGDSISGTLQATNFPHVKNCSYSGKRLDG